MLEGLFGMVSGIVTGLGMGGGTILILLLSLFMDLEQHIAQAINLVFFIPTSIAAILINIKQKNIDYKIARIITLSGIIGSIIGAIISQSINSTSLRKLFAIFIIIIAIHEIFDLYKEYINKRRRHTSSS